MALQTHRQLTRWGTVLAVLCGLNSPACLSYAWAQADNYQTHLTGSNSTINNPVASNPVAGNVYNSAVTSNTAAGEQVGPATSIQAPRTTELPGAPADRLSSGAIDSQQMGQTVAEWTRSSSHQESADRAALSQPAHTSMTPQRMRPTAGSTESAGDASATQTADGAVAKRTPLAPPSDSLQTGSQSVSPAKSLVTMGSSLLLVVGLILALVWCLRKSGVGSQGGGLPREVFSVLGRTTIGNRQQILVLRFGSRLVLVSMIQGEARTLCEIDDATEVEDLTSLLLGQASPAAPATGLDVTRALAGKLRSVGSTVDLASEKQAEDSQNASDAEMRSFRSILNQGASL